MHLENNEINNRVISLRKNEKEKYSYKDSSGILIVGSNNFWYYVNRSDSFPPDERPIQEIIDDIKTKIPKDVYGDSEGNKPLLIPNELNVYFFDGYCSFDIDNEDVETDDVNV
ncbi:MAG: hypothetical protein EHM58_16545 [Ignavibacteriae bacterium]|nr:MAG: hypothetical protein EHM58_16545 [Ignavibacteriota bacterium]